jgi:hypothetical protein
VLSSQSYFSLQSLDGSQARTGWAARVALPGCGTCEIIAK